MKAVFLKGGVGPQVTTDIQTGSEEMNVFTVHLCFFLDIQSSASRQQSAHIPVENMLES